MKKITIGVYHSLSSAYSELVAQKIQQSIVGKYPLKIEPYNAENHYDLLLMNTNNEPLVAQYDHYYIFRILVIVMTCNQLKKSFNCYWANNLKKA